MMQMQFVCDEYAMSLYVCMYIHTSSTYFEKKKKRKRGRNRQGNKYLMLDSNNNININNQTDPVS